MSSPRAVLHSLVALDILSKHGQAYGLTPDADVFLVEGRPGDLTPLLEIHTGLTYENWGQLTDLLRHPVTIRQYRDLDQAAEFFPKLIRGIMPLALDAADATAQHLGIGTQRKGVRVLDIGVGGAAWSIPFAKRDAAARITGFDIPEVLVHTKQIVSEVRRRTAVFVSARESFDGRPRRFGVRRRHPRKYVPRPHPGAES